MFYSDVIGLLTDVGEEREYIKNKQKSKLIAIELDNEGCKYHVNFEFYNLCLTPLRLCIKN